MPKVGSHSSGGSFSHSSGGSSSFGGGYGGGHHHHGPHRSRVFIFFGHRYYSRSNISVIFFIFMMFALFFSVPFWMIQSNIQKNLQLLKNDYFYYQELAQAETPINAIPLRYESYQIYEGNTYYYITFKIPSSDFFEDHQEYETTSTYTIYEAKQIMNNKTLLVCTNGSNAIQADFNINTDKEYAYQINEFTTNRNNAKRTAIILTISGVAFGAIAIIIFAKTLKRLNDNEPIPEFKKYNNNPTTHTANNTNYTTSDENETYYCSYCGNKVSSYVNRCPECGAKIRR